MYPGDLKLAPRLPAFNSFRSFVNPKVIEFSNPFYGVKPKTLLVIAPETFMSALEPFVKHKNDTGIPTIAVSISDIKEFFKGVDDPEIIKRGIEYAYDKLFIRYVMLVGDAHMFPVRYMYYHCLSKAFPDSVAESVPTDGDYIASDLYYANLYRHKKIGGSGIKPEFDNWDANGNGLYNEGYWDPSTTSYLDKVTTLNPDKVDGYPDVVVGRIPAHTEADVKSYVNKVISYETSTDRYSTRRKRKFTFVADKEYDSGVETPELLAYSGLDVNPYVSKEFLMIENDTNPEITGWKNATPDDVANSAKDSIWVSYDGHGGPNGWGAGEVFKTSHIALTKSSSALPVVFAAACQTGEFIMDFPWNDPYEDAAGNRHNFARIPQKSDGFIEDVDNAERFPFDSTNKCLTKPVVMPRPHIYDIDRGDRALAFPWLIGNVPGGSIAYFGEMGVSPDWMGVELEKFMLESYVNDYNPILGDIYLKAQRQYWYKHKGELDSTEAAPRMYLGWMVFFGDPSLRLPRIADPSLIARVELDNLQEALEQQRIPNNYIQYARAYVAYLSEQLSKCDRKFPRSQEKSS